MEKVVTSIPESDDIRVIEEKNTGADPDVIFEIGQPEVVITYPLRPRQERGYT